MKLFTKLVLCMVMVVMMAVAVITLFSIRKQTEVLSSELISGKQQIATQIADAAKNAFQTASLLFMERMLKDACTAQDIVFCRIVKPDNTIYLADKRQDYGAAIDSEIANATEPLLDYVFPITGERGKIIIEPVELSGETWKIILGVSFRDIEHANRTVVRHGIYIALVITASTTLIALVLSRGLTNPVARLAHATEKIAGGDLEYSVEVGSAKDEVGALAQSFNKMIQSLRISQGKLKSYSQSLEDEIAERKRAEEALQRISNEQAVLLSTVPAMIFWIDKEGKFIRVNEAFAAALHKSPDGIEGKYLFDLYPEDMARRFHNDNLEVMDSDTPKRHIEEPVETPREVMWASTDKIPYSDENGEVIGIIGFSVDITQRKQVEEALQKARDELENRVEERTFELKAANKQLQQEITERKQAEAALAEERNLLRTLIDNVPDQIYVKDTESRFVIANASLMRLVGATSPEKIIGKTDFDFLSREVSAQYYAYEQEIMRSGQPVINKEEADADTEGNRTWALTTKVPLRDSSAKIIGLVGINRDITELKRAEEALQHRLEVEERITAELEEKTEELSRSNEELNALLYTIAHDVKAHATSFQILSALLANDCGDEIDENGRVYIHRIRKNSEHMGTLIEGILELSSIGKAKVREQSVDISALISDVADELAPELEKRGTRLIVKDGMPELRCDRAGVRQIFANLISNASKFMGEDNGEPMIEVGYDGLDSYHKFYVKDNGIGIDEEYHEKIFQVLQRLNDIEAEGTGVGLTIVKKIVENLGGEIRVDSAKGKGTTMYFTVPSHKKEGQ